MGCATSSPTAGASAVEEIVINGSPESSDRDGKAFHRLFTAKTVIGKGSFAQVHLAKEVSTGRNVAVKVLDLRHPINEDGQRKQGRLNKKLRAATREVAMLQLVGQHPNVTDFHGHFLDEALMYLVMELCPSSLPRALQEAPDVTESLYAGVFRQVFRALEHVHLKGVVHRDVKADNFLCSHVDGGVAVKLCDFGLAAAAPSGKGAAILGGTFGTAPYMSPEMVCAKGYGTGTDVWSAGVMAYVLMLGDFPYRPRGQPCSDNMKNVIAKGVPEPSYRPWRPHNGATPSPRVSMAGEQFLRSVLERESGARPTSTEVLASEWLQPRSPSCDEPSLKPALLGAKYHGAFDPRNGIASWKTRSLEDLMWIGQEREKKVRSKAALDRPHCQRQVTPEAVSSMSTPLRGDRTEATDSDTRLHDDSASGSDSSWSSFKVTI